MSDTPYTKKQRVAYWFDNLMAQGMWAKIRLLLISTIIFIFLAGTLVVAVDPAMTAQEGIWKTFMLVLGKGGRADVEGATWLSTALLLLVVFYAMFFMATLIGLINTGLRTKIDNLAKGHSPVLESEHTLILGFNEATFTLIAELIQANESQPTTQCIVVLDEADQVLMEEAMLQHFGPTRLHPKTKILCRSGLCSDFEALRRCSILSTRSVIVNTANDFETIKAVMACSYIMNEEAALSDSYSVAVIHAAENETPAQIAGFEGKENDRLELLAMQDVLARIMVHTSRQPGLASVFTELFNFSGHEMYVLEDDYAFGQFYGKTIAEINRYLKTAIAIGVVAGGEEICIGQPHSVVFQEGDYLIVIAEDDTALDVETDAPPMQDLKPSATITSGVMRGIILGAYSITQDVLHEYAQYLQEGSSLLLIDASTNPEADDWVDWKQTFAHKGVDFAVQHANVMNRRALHHALDTFQPDSVLVLSNSETLDLSEEDKRIITLLLYLREYRSTRSQGFGITSEINFETNRALASATSADDYIVGRHIAALLMAQISQNRKMRDLFTSFLSSEGFEVYIKKAANYVPLGEDMDLYSVGQAVANRGDIFIGLRQMQDGRYFDAIVNPPKYSGSGQSLAQYRFTDNDYFVVLSEDMDFKSSSKLGSAEGNVSNV